MTNDLPARCCRQEPTAAETPADIDAVFEVVRRIGCDGVCAVDGAGRAVRVDAGWVRMLGRPAEALVGRGISETLRSPGSAEVAACIAETLAAGAGGRRLEWSIRDGQGRPRWLDVVLVPVRDDATGRGPGEAVVACVARESTARLTAAEEAVAREAALRQFYDEAPVMMHSIDAAGRVCAVNRCWLEHLGYTREQVVGRPVTELMTPESAERALLEVMPRFWRLGYVRDEPYDFVRADGRVAHVLLDCRAVEAPDGRPRSLTVMRDVTASRAQQRALQVAEAFMESGTDALLTVDPGTGRIVEAAGRAEAMLGYGPDALAGMPVEALSAAPAGVVLENPAGWVEAATERGQALVEWRMRRSDGTEFPAEISCRAMTMDGTPRVLAGVRDVTERKRAEADMLLVREALDDCGTAVLILNQAHRAQYINAAFGSLFGFTPDRAAMVRLGHLFEDAALAETIEANVFSGASWAGEAAMHTKEHRRFPASVRATPVLDEDFTVAGGLLIINDISRRKHMEGQLRQSQNLKSIGQLAAGIAHEINTPMQYVGDNLRFLQGAFGDLLRLVERGGEAAAALGEAAPGHPAEAAFSEAAVDADAEYLAEEAPLALGQSLEGVERVTRIVGAMRQFTHPGAEEKRLADLNAAMESTATVARNEWRYVADLDLDLEDGLPPVPCIPGEINQVFLNLIVNAAHAIGEVVGDGSDGRGRITVTSRSEPGWVTFSVADTGTGITPEVRERIFDPFFTTKEVGQGTGQGLSISYSVITEKHGGELTFETEVGRGSVFHVRLPLAPPDEAGE